MLDDKLKELSGLAYCQGAIWGTDDEEGILYRIDLQEGTLLEELAWGDDNDYEGVGCLSDNLYVLESDGDIFAVQKNGEDAEKFETRLDKDCDAEGLGALPTQDALLIACKDGKGDKRKLHRFKDGKVDDEPYLTLDSDDVMNFIETELFDEVSLILKEFLIGDKEVLFPSALAFHPITEELFLLSGRNRLLLVYDRAGRLKNVTPLSHEALPQPEAITFLPNGDLLIGSEGKGGQAAILIFTYEQK